MIFLFTSDRARCQEELQILPVEKRRLRTWLDKMIMAVELSLSECKSSLEYARSMLGLSLSSTAFAASAVNEDNVLPK